MNGLVPLAALRPGQSAEVVTVAATDRHRLMKLASLGMVPGVVITLRQWHPACILDLGETELSLDGEVTREIMMRVLP